MKTILKYLLVALMLLACETAKGQGIKIMDLPILSSPDSSIDWIPTSHYGTTYRVKIGKLFHEFGGGGGGGSVSGSNTQIQYNNSGAFGASADFTWNNLSKLFTVDGDISIGLWSTNYPLISTSVGDGFLYLGDPFATNTGIYNGIYIGGTDNVHIISEQDITSTSIDMGNDIDGSVSQINFLEISTNGLNYTGFKSPDSRSANLIYTLPSADPTSGQVLSSGAPSSGVAALSWITPSGTGTVTSIATTSPITGGTITTTGTIGINDAAADGSTKGAASFSAGDFNSTSGNITIDYLNANHAGTSTTGFLTDTDWDIFNDKVSATRTISTTSPLSGGGDLSANITLTIADAAADGTTKGAASFTAADFNSSTGLISLDYTNGQAASTSTKGFLTDTDWDLFNDKLAATGTMTGATSQKQDFTNGIGTPIIDDDGAGSIELSFSTVTKAVFSSGGLQITPDGSAISPSLALGTTNHGFYEKTNTELGVSIQGSLVGGFNTAGLFINTISEYSAANGVTIDGVNLKDGLVVGQYGGTGVNNSGKTITLGGNLTTSGAHATTLTTTGTTGVTLPTSGTLATLAGTETFTNKSIVATQLTGTAYTIAANNTNATAAYTLEAYENHPLATYAGTIDFNGTDPATIISQQYRWSKVAGFVTLTLNVLYTTPGTTNTSATFTLPSDCPAPVVIANSGDAASEYMYPICGARVEANQTANPSAVRGGIRQNASNNGYEIALIFGSVSALSASFTIIYPIN